MLRKDIHREIVPSIEGLAVKQQFPADCFVRSGESIDIRLFRHPKAHAGNEGTGEQ